MRITNKPELLKSFLFTLLISSALAMTAACQTNPPTAEEIVKTCQTFLDKDDLQGANECVQKAMFANPQNAEEISRLSTDAIFQKCNNFKNRENYKQAIICYEGAAELMPNSANVQFNLADSYYNYAKGKTIKDFETLNRAEEAIKKGLGKKSNDSLAYSLYGDILQEKGEINDSLLQHQKAVEIQSDSGILWIKLGRIQEIIRKDNDALISYQKAVKLDPKDTDALFFLSSLYEKLGKIDEAIEAIEKQNKIEPPNQETLNKLKELKERQISEKSKKAKPKSL